MKNVLVIGAGRSATSLIKYLLKGSDTYDWKILVADTQLSLATEKIGGHGRGEAVCFDVNNSIDRIDLIRGADLVISMLPPQFHQKVAQDCLSLKKHLITASYLSAEMQDLDEAVVRDSLIMMGEMGLDPGIDHMSAVQKIEEIKAKGGKINSFRSYTGGLVAPESDTNPWHYKFTWNPLNVVLAGKGTAQYLEDGKYKYLPYHHLFTHTQDVDVEGVGALEMYANRDSLAYRKHYGLDQIPNILRGTLRYRGFCEAWDALITLGLTDDTFLIKSLRSMRYKDLVEAYVPVKTSSLEDSVAHHLGVPLESEIMDKLTWLGLFGDRTIDLESANPAQILLELLLEKWKLEPEDKDMIVMLHEFEYELGGRKYLLTSTMVHKGVDAQETAMTRLVGWPLGICARLILEGKYTKPGVQIPVCKAIYDPVLEELESLGVCFVERVIEIAD